VKQVVYITGNKIKILTAESYLNPLGIKVIGKKIDCPEIQADSIEEVAIYSSQYANKALNETVLKNDTGLIITALHNFPGPYTKFIEETLTEDGILKLMKGIESREAYFLEVYALTENGGKTKTFTSRTNGRIALEKSGQFGWGYDHIFIPDGKDKTLANYDDETRSKIWSGEALMELAEYLK
jgi:XTP/dITP diphosphohydrolase